MMSHIEDINIKGRRFCVAYCYVANSIKPKRVRKEKKEAKNEEKKKKKKK